jgi:hypothetical protein
VESGNYHGRECAEATLDLVLSRKCNLSCIPVDTGNKLRYF